MADEYKIRSIEDLTNAIVLVDNFLDELQNDDPVFEQEELVRLRQMLDAVLKFFDAEG